MTNAIEKAQRKVEGRNFDIRKQLLEFDDVANDQRQVIYQQRNDLMASEDVSEVVTAIRSDVVESVVNDYIPPQSIEEQWDVAGLETYLESEFATPLSVQQWLDDDDKLHEEQLREKILVEIQQAYEEKEKEIGPDMRIVEKQIMLQVLDHLWKEHLQTMDHLRQGINLRAYAQKNPKQEYKRESFELFQGMLEAMKHDVVRFLSRIQVQRQDEVEALERQRREELARQQEQARLDHAEVSSLAEEGAPPAGDDNTEAAAAQPFVRDGRKVGRNEPCPCGSGKKFKQCHGALEQ